MIEINIGTKEKPHILFYAGSKEQWEAEQKALAKCEQAFEMKAMWGEEEYIAE